MISRDNDRLVRKGDVVWTRWAEVDRIFDLSLDLPESERDAAIGQVCGDDIELREAVLDLLARSQSPDTRITTPGPDLLRAVLPADDDGADGIAIGDVVGRYRIRGELGRGGMATVYEAERSDGAYRQLVALKVLRRGLDTDRIVDRFLAERQILSDFAHPNVARLLDGGATADGRPYLVMEKVDGRPLTQWADDERLGTTARLRLFIQAADAVQEAHRRLVVHRDLKPSNIMVDRSGQVKLLDFGIAKLLNPDADDDLTQLEQRPLTRRYASPEQASGKPVTTSSDVYQLGLILYELLTGLWPFKPGPHGLPDRDGLCAPSQAVLAGDDPDDRAARRGSTSRTLGRRLAGDLDTIVSKALEPDPLDRYRSVEDLAHDVRLHLEGRPIRARPAPRSLRARKWFGRNPWAVPVAAVLAVAAVGYIGTLTLSSRRLERERNEARAQAARAERIKGFLIELFRTADPFEGSDPAASGAVTVVDALAPAADRIRSELRDDPVMQADLLAAVASILENLDRQAEGLPMIEEALALRAAAGRAQTADFAADLLVLSQTIDYEQPDSAARVLERAIATLRATVPPGDPRLADALAQILLLRIKFLGSPDLSAGEEALAIYEAAGPQYREAGAAVLSTLAQAYRQGGRLDEAEDAARRALRRHQDNLGRNHPQTAVTGAVLAGVLDARNRFEDAIPLYRESVEVLELTAGPDHNQTLATRNNLATTLHLSGRPEEAVAIHRQILESHRRRQGTDIDREVAGSLQNLAAALNDQGALAEADSLAALAYDIYVRTTPEGHYIRAFPLLTRTEILLKLGEPARAEQTAALAAAILEGALSVDHYVTGVARCRLGAALAGQGRRGEAASHVQSGLEILRADERTPPDYLDECERTQLTP